jgi:purine-nucleoside phosphorylase
MAFNELNTKFYTEKSVLDILKLIQWKKDSKKYNFEVLPKTAIITLEKSFLDNITRFFTKRIKGITGKNYQINKNILVCTSFGNGAPAIIGLLEELQGLGVENFIFIGYAGSLDANYIESDICIVKKAFSTTGCAALYSKNEFFKPKNNDWFSNLESKLNYKESICWSTDAPFRETPSLINHFIEKKATHVDMECAAIYAFAEFYNLNALCLLVTSDSLSHENWKHPKNLELLNNTIKKVLKQCINIFSNE